MLTEVLTSLVKEVSVNAQGMEGAYLLPLEAISDAVRELLEPCPKGLVAASRLQLYWGAPRVERLVPAVLQSQPPPELYSLGKDRLWVVVTACFRRWAGVGVGGQCESGV